MALRMKKIYMAAIHTLCKFQLISKMQQSQNLHLIGKKISKKLSELQLGIQPKNYF